MPSTQPTDPAFAGTPHAGATSRRRPARWWLAGLLVGCLLPAGMAQAEGLRQVERVIQVCILAPALIRASSRLQARRRALLCWPSLRHRLPRCRRAARPRIPQPLRRRLTAALDVLTRRGPPSALAY